MKGILTERNLAATLFVLVLVTFSFAQKETKKLEQFYNGGNTALGRSVDVLIKQQLHSAAVKVSSTTTFKSN